MWSAGYSHMAASTQNTDHEEAFKRAGGGKKIQVAKKREREEVEHGGEQWGGVFAAS